MTRISDAQNFLDINGLNSLRQGAKSSDQENKKAALNQAAKQFEAIFTQMLLKSMRKAQEVLESDSPFNSQSTKFYRDMHDQQMSLELSQNGSLGLSELIVRQLGGDQENFTPRSILRNDGNLDSRGMTVAAKPKLTDVVKVSSLDPDPTQDRQTNGSNLVKLANNMHKADFQQPQDFVSALAEDAKRVEAQLKVPFEVVIAQAALETGWGKKIIRTAQGESSNNLFNIKADKRWAGKQTQKETLEFENGAMVKKKEPFRVYDSIAQSFNDYVDFLSNNERYQGALKQTENVEQFLHNLQSAGYATDPNYAKKIMGTLRKVTSLINK